ncbi:MAG TPA: hypothetical protein VGL81_16945 [Polyangiaceae bacterium]|jgi:hypothetical protein
MSDPRLSPATRTLLRAAKADAPSAVARAKVWSSVAGAVGGAAGAAGAAGSASTAPGVLVTGGAGASKLLALGTLFGGTVTVGLAAMLLRVGPAPRDPLPPPSAPMAVLTAASPAAQPVPSLLPLVVPPAAPTVTAAPRAPSIPPNTGPAPAVAPRPVGLAGANTAAAPRAPSTSAATPADTLAREASLVVEGREALERGDPQGALRAIHAARMLPSHQLGPEELAVEARALRALGRDDQAREVDSTLRRRFPDSALAR